MANTVLSVLTSDALHKIYKQKKSANHTEFFSIQIYTYFPIFYDTNFFNLTAKSYLCSTTDWKSNGKREEESI